MPGNPSLTSAPTPTPKHGEYIPKDVYESIEREQSLALKGPVTTPIGGGFSSINVHPAQKVRALRQLPPHQDPCPGWTRNYPGVDLIIVRENTEGEYVGLEVVVVPGVAQSLKIITEKGSTRIARAAFEYARKHGRKRIHSIHKANIMKLTDGLFLDCARKVAAEFPEIEYKEHIVDNTCMQLVLNPYQYDILLTENLYGDILSDLCSAFVGGLGLVPGANLGADVAIFEAVHGSAPDIAGQDKANPTALLQSAILMLDHLNEPETANTIRKALETVYREGKSLTRDVGGSAGTQAFAQAVIGAL